MTLSERIQIASIVAQRERDEAQRRLTAQLRSDLSGVRREIVLAERHLADLHEQEQALYHHLHWHREVAA